MFVYNYITIFLLRQYLFYIIIFIFVNYCRICEKFIFMIYFSGKI